MTTVTELCLEIQANLKIPVEIVVLVFDMDFNEWLQLESLDDLSGKGACGTCSATLTRK